MPIVTLRLPKVKQKTEIRPKECPYCQGAIFQRWGKVRKPVKDNQIRNVCVYRYRCCHCGRTFRHYPEGVGRATQTQRLQKLVSIFWVLGMSLRGVALALSLFDITISHMTVWRDLQEQAEELDKRRRCKTVRAIGIDGTYPLAQGEKQPVLIAVDVGNGKPVAIGKVDEYNPQAVKRWLEPLVKQLGVRVIVSDDLASFRIAAEELEVDHQVCQFHVRRWVGRALHDLGQTVPKEWQWVVEEVRQLLDDLPPNGNHRLFDLWMQIPECHMGQSGQHKPLKKLRNLLIRMSNHWDSYRLFERQKDVPWTNNVTEQAIGRMKMRSRTVRGYKSWHGLWAAFMLTGSGLAW